MWTTSTTPLLRVASPGISTETVDPGGIAVAAVDHGEIRGLGVVRPCRGGYKIGPCSQHPPDLAETIFARLSGHAIDEPLFLDIPECNPAAVALARSSSSTSPSAARMYRGPVHVAPAASSASRRSSWGINAHDETPGGRQRYWRWPCWRCRCCRAAPRRRPSTTTQTSASRPSGASRTSPPATPATAGSGPGTADALALPLRCPHCPRSMSTSYRPRPSPPCGSSPTAGHFRTRKTELTFGNREGLLPPKKSGFTGNAVVTPGSQDRGARRIVAGADGSRYWTDDHYNSFSEVIQP